MVYIDGKNPSLSDWNGFIDQKKEGYSKKRLLHEQLHVGNDNMRFFLDNVTTVNLITLITLITLVINHTFLNNPHTPSFAFVLFLYIYSLV